MSFGSWLKNIGPVRWVRYTFAWNDSDHIKAAIEALEKVDSDRPGLYNDEIWDAANHLSYLKDYSTISSMMKWKIYPSPCLKIAEHSKSIISEALKHGGWEKAADSAIIVGIYHGVLDHKYLEELVHQVVVDGNLNYACSLINTHGILVSASDLNEFMPSHYNLKSYQVAGFKSFLDKQIKKLSDINDYTYNQYNATEKKAAIDLYTSAYNQADMIYKILKDKEKVELENKMHKVDNIIRDVNDDLKKIEEQRKFNEMQERINKLEKANESAKVNVSYNDSYYYNPSASYPYNPESYPAPSAPPYEESYDYYDYNVHYIY